MYELIPILACDPVTLLGASLAISAASGVAQYQSQKNMAKATAKTQRDVSKSLAAQTAANMSDQIAMTREEELQNARQREATKMKAASVRASGMASAMESGIDGESVAALDRDYLGQAAQIEWASMLSDAQARTRLDRNLDRQAAAHTAKQVSNFRPINQPSVLGQALKTGGEMGAAVSTYYGGGFGKKSKYEGTAWYKA